MRVRVLLAAGVVLASLLSPIAADAASTTPSAANAISKDKAKKLAKAALLKKTDLPGYQSGRQQADPTDAQYDAALYDCVGAVKPKYIVDNPGLAFTKGQLEIDSQASVVDTGKHAKADAKALNTAKGATCYQQVLRSAFEDQGVIVNTISVKLAKATVEGVRTAFAFKYDLTGTINGAPIRLQGFDLNVLVGQTEVGLSIYRYDGKRPKLNQLVLLAAPLVERIRAV